MKGTKIIFFLLLFVIANDCLSQSPEEEGAIRLTLIEFEEILDLNDKILVKYIPEQEGEIIHDEIYFDPENKIPAKYLPVGLYKIEIFIKSFPLVEIVSVPVLSGRLTFLEHLSVQEIKNANRILKLKYKMPLSYKCG